MPRENRKVTSRRSASFLGEHGNGFGLTNPRKGRGPERILGISNLLFFVATITTPYMQMDLGTIATELTLY